MPDLHAVIFSVGLNVTLRMHGGGLAICYDACSCFDMRSSELLFAPVSPGCLRLFLPALCAFFCTHFSQCSGPIGSILYVACLLAAHTCLCRVHLIFHSTAAGALCFLFPWVIPYDILMSLLPLKDSYLPMPVNHAMSFPLLLML